MQALRRGPFHLIRESFLLAFKNFGHLPVGDPFRVELAELTVLAAGVVLESRRIEEGWVGTMGILSFPADSYLEMTDKTESMDYIMEKRGRDPFPQTVRSKKTQQFRHRAPMDRFPRTERRLFPVFSRKRKHIHIRSRALAASNR